MKGLCQYHRMRLDPATMDALRKRYISLDVETTGLSPYNDRIIEVGAVLFENAKIAGRFGSLVNPGLPIPRAATAVNNITNDMIKTAPLEAEVYHDLVRFLGDALDNRTALCAHNASFDLGFLSRTLERFGYGGTIRYVDTLTLSRELVRGLANYKQDTVASHFGLINEEAHRAVSDATVCGILLRNLLNL